jgi:hypothetical protein
VRGLRIVSVVALAVGLALAAAPERAQAQLAAECSGSIATPEVVSGCANAVEGLLGTRDGLGVGHSLAAAIPGSASALGRRFGATPRVAVSGRMGIVRFDRAVPDSWSTREPASGWTPVFGAQVGVGVFDGFSIAPTIGGVFALDLIGDVSTIRLPSDDGFEGASLAWGYGVRIGLIRESFTLPGVSLSILRRSGASFAQEGTEGSLNADVATTSIRAAVGKELLGLGFHGGAGWDRVSAEGALQVTPAGGPGPAITFSDVASTRFVVFGGVTRTFLITSLGADFGWSDGVAFGSVSLRLTL